MPFEPSKNFVYVRSPNGSREFDRVLDKRMIPESGGFLHQGDNEYSLIHSRVLDLESGFWARNKFSDVYGFRIEKRENPHLDN